MTCGRSELSVLTSSLPSICTALCRPSARCHDRVVSRVAWPLSSASLPRTIRIHSNEVVEAITEPLEAIIGAVRAVLEETPPELSSDIIDKGMILTGGGALLRGLSDLLTEVTGVPCYVADDPLSCVAVGTGLALEYFDILRDSLEEP